MLQMADAGVTRVLDIDALVGLESVWEIALVGHADVARPASLDLINLYCSVTGSVRSQCDATHCSVCYSS